MVFRAFIIKAVEFSTVLLFGSTGETLIEKSGHLNLGIPGIMCAGALGGCFGVSFYVGLAGVKAMSGVLVILFGMLFAMLFAGALGAVYSFMTVSLRCNQNVTGLTITTLGVGLTNFFINRIPTKGFSQAANYYVKLFTFYPQLGGFGQVVLSYGFLTYFAIIVSLVCALVLKKTKIGLYLRAVGENPATADAAGISVTKYRYLATVIGSGIAGLGGLFYVFNYLLGMWEYTIDGLGWLSIALVIFTVWKPDFGILGAFVFGCLYCCKDYISGLSLAQKELLQMTPYVVTIIVLIITSVLDSKNAQPPASLGLNYFREDR